MVLGAGWGAQACATDRPADDRSAALGEVEGTRTAPTTAATFSATDRGIDAPTDRWAPITPSPLTERHGEIAVWTGSELVVVGGTTSHPCPDHVDCIGPSPGTMLRDGAAYDPYEETWRPIAEAPFDLLWARASWSAREVVVIASDGVAGYDPETDRWRELDPVPGHGDVNQTLLTDDGLVVVGYQRRARDAGPVDWMLDPDTGAWTSLPPDPFGESYDRSIAWDGERYWLLSMDAAHHYAAHRGAPSRVAVLTGGPGGTWQVVDEETPDLVYGQRWWWLEDRLVAPRPPQYAASARRSGVAFDPETRNWGDLPVPTEPEPGECELTATDAPYESLPAPGGSWVVDDELLWSPATEALVNLPDCATYGGRLAGTWMDDVLLGRPVPSTENLVPGGVVWRPAAG